MALSPISTLVDLSIIHHSNLNLIVKNAVQYIDRMKTADREINGLSFEYHPNKTGGAVTITLKSSKDGKFSDRYESPETYHQKLTLACFLLAVSKLTNLETRAHILCTNASGRGDTQMSISTKHPKSKLQEQLNGILDDEDFIESMKSQINISLPDTLSDIQTDLIKLSTSGNISKRDINRIKSNYSVEDLDIYLELEDLRRNEDIVESYIPHINFRKFSIDEVVEILKSNKIAIALQKEIDLISKELEELSVEKTLFEKEITRMGKRNLWQRIFNR